MSISFDRNYPFEYAVVQTPLPWLRRVVARNPGPFTFKGTGTFIIGKGNVAIIDPGPDLPEHIDAVLDAVRGETVSHLLITHTHRDHSPASAAIKSATGAASYAYGPHGAGALERGVQVEEGGDMEFVPDHEMRHGDVIDGDGFTMECVFTPGHTSNHMCFAYREQQALFSGDHVMGWNTTIVSPPDGDMADYMASLDLLLARDDKFLLPTHGPAITNPRPFVRAYKAHRKVREQQILSALKDGARSIAQMVPDMYQHLPEAMYPAASRSVLATIIYLVQLGQIAHDGELGMDALYRLA